MRKKPLTDRQTKFVDEYLLDLNGTQAAIRAGYSRRHASQIGYQQLQKTSVSSAIQAAQEQRARRTGVDADRVIRELARIAFANMTRLATWNQRTVTLRSSEELEADDSAAVAEISESKFCLKIRLHDKVRALEKLGDHLGLWKKDPADLLDLFLAGLPEHVARGIREGIRDSCQGTRRDASKGQDGNGSFGSFAML